jgi:mRNA-degrading endonuclease YafQ of YafQ-DinJ toxin-antitoxin module
MSKTISVNGTDVVCAHTVKVGKNHKTELHLTVSAGDGADGVSLVHVLTVGAEGKPMPANYGQTELQADFERFRQQHAELCESKFRAKKLAAAIVE